MASKPRTLTLDDRKFVYALNVQYANGTSTVTLNLFRAERRNRGFSFRFHTWEDAAAGSPLMVGIDLRRRDTGETERWNLHHPSRMRLLILYALEQGWNGDTQVEVVDGITVLEQMGWEAESLRP
ncbi:hypothetical protein B9G55_06370 [Saccharibacillus sp. O16]|nr:hypothetical protein B9G55_06370 [Saccharibacillus sp. O16]